MPHNWFTSFYRDWGLSCRDGEFTLHVIDYVRWRYLFAQAVERTLAAVGHPCCFMGIGSFPPVGRACHKALTWGIQFDVIGQRVVVVIPVTIEGARKISPEFVEEQLSLALDED
ncbi:hypothetical protein [Nakamurella lactea]|uniref:hypothetical protein n=1 Tax=Nakamurella lactea TaxID=459515 RepID=UPI0003F91FC2|nr:hypothetical protein [Nakamurella lactea]